LFIALALQLAIVGLTPVVLLELRKDECYLCIIISSLCFPPANLLPLSSLSFPSFLSFLLFFNVAQVLSQLLSAELKPTTHVFFQVRAQMWKQNETTKNGKTDRENRKRGRK
jgi:hypothetical protein